MEDIDFLLKRFPEQLRERGRAYQRQGRVRIETRSKGSVEAVVRGTQEYEVGLKRTPEGWSHACSCPAHLDRGKCKHVCALLWQLKASGTNIEVSSESSLDGIPPRSKAMARAPRDDGDLDFKMYNSELERLVTDPNLPSALRDQLLQGLLLAGEGSGFGRQSQGPASGRQLLEELAASPPRPNSASVDRKLRYVLAEIEYDREWVELTIEVARISTRGLGPYRTLRESLRNVSLDETDETAVAVLIEGPKRGFFRHSQSGGYLGPFSLQPALQRWLLPKLAAAGRLWIACPGRDSEQLALDAGGPWRFLLDVRRTGKQFELHGSLERAAERIPCGELACVLAGGFAVARNTLLEVEWSGAHAWAKRLSFEQATRVPAGKSGELARVLALAPAALPIDAPDLVDEVGGSPRSILNLLKPIEGDSRLQARLEFAYGEERVSRGGPVVAVKDGRVWRLRRDETAEALALEQFTAAGGRLHPPVKDNVADFDAEISRIRFGALVRTLEGQGWLVEGEGRKLHSGGSTSLSVKSGVDWFEVEARLDFDGASLQLPELLQAVATRQTLVRLSDGSYGLLPEEWLSQWSGLKAIGEIKGQTLRVSRARGFLLDILLAQGDNVQLDAQFTELRQRLARAKKPVAAREPQGFVGELRPYQREGLGWLGFLGQVGLGGCLADDMGLGKTVQLLAFLLTRREQAKGPSLVVAPKSLLFNWASEAQRFAPKLRVCKHHGVERSRQRSALEDADLVLTTYGTLRQDFELLKDVSFDVVVLDEAQSIKNPGSQSAKAARLLRADMRFALTGTPIENRVEDMLSIFEFLNPGLLEGSRALRGLLESSDEVATARLAAQALGPFLLRRTKEQVLKDLPGKTEQLVSCELEGVQRREYDALRKHYRSTLLAKVEQVGMAKASMNVLEALLRLRQAACHLALIDPKHARSASAKLETLLEMLVELRESGHKALVFSQFTGFLALVRAALEEKNIAFEYLDGKTSDRSARVERFQGNAGPSVFLVSLKAGGVGLNLTAADYVFLLDPWWNPAVERQAIDRTHRIGQTRPVTAYRLVARDTVEEKVLALQEHKRNVADALFEGSGKSLREFTRADLEALLS